MRYMNNTLISASLLLTVALSTFPLYADDIQISISSPVNGSAFETCADIQVTADPVINSGSIQQVNFYRNGIPAAIDRREPYDWNYRNVGNGYYEITAGAVGSDDVEIISDPVFFIVGPWIQGNRILNSQFDCSLAPWTIGQYEGGAATATIDPEAEVAEGGAVYIEINNPGDYFWSVQLMQDFPVLAGHTYEISFVAEVPIDKEITYALQMDHDPFTSYLEESVTLVGNNFYGPYTFECTVDDPTVELKLMISGDDTPVYFDDVMIVDLNMEPVTSVEQDAGLSPENQILTNSYPNPFNGQTKIIYQLPRESGVTIQILNIQGKAVRHLLDETQTAGYHFVHWNGKDDAGQPLASGVYLYRIDAKAPHHQHRVTRRIHLIQ